VSTAQRRKGAGSRRGGYVCGMQAGKLSKRWRCGREGAGAVRQRKAALQAVYGERQRVLFTAQRPSFQMGPCWHMRIQDTGRTVRRRREERPAPCALFKQQEKQRALNIRRVGGSGVDEWRAARCVAAGRGVSCVRREGMVKGSPENNDSPPCCRGERGG